MHAKIKQCLFGLWLMGLMSQATWASPAKPLAVDITDRNTFQICYGFHCAQTKHVTITNKVWQSIDAAYQSMEADLNDQKELQFIRHAAAALEMAAGMAAGIDDLPKNLNAPDRGWQLDCIDEASNMRTYVTLLFQEGYLIHHVPHDVVHKGFFPGHWVFSIRNIHTNALWAVESWYLDIGLPPYIQKLTEWKKARLGKPKFDCRLNPEGFEKKYCRKETLLR